MLYDVADVEPRWAKLMSIVAHKQDVFVAIDVNGLIGRCRGGKLCVPWLKRYMVSEVSRRNRRNSASVT